VSAAGKRKKIVDEAGYDSDPSHPSHSKDMLLGEGGIDEQDQGQLQDELSLGCGRLMCRRCCYEDVPACVRVFLFFLQTFH
jgi:hypothetical protein